MLPGMIRKLLNQWEILLNQWEMDGKQIVSPVISILPVVPCFGRASGQSFHPASQLPI